MSPKNVKKENTFYISPETIPEVESRYNTDAKQNVGKLERAFR